MWSAAALGKCRTGREMLKNLYKSKEKEFANVGLRNFAKTEKMV
jgi:hypothetical protein